MKADGNLYESAEEGGISYTRNIPYNNLQQQKMCVTDMHWHQTQ